MAKLEKPAFDAQAFLNSVGLGENSSIWRPNRLFLRREILRTLFSICRAAVQKSPLFPQPARRRP
jgi:hypothetical protein